MSVAQQTHKKGHICPPSGARHPAYTWESLYVYAFICRFTGLRSKVEGFETSMDFEDALIMPGADPIISKILQQFILNLRPQTRNLSVDQLSSTLSGILSDTLKTTERTIFWDDELGVNMHPLANLEGGFFAADWALKLKILRLLVDVQLAHSTEIKNIIDRAWGVTQHKHKKKDPESAPPDASDAKSQERLRLVPLGQDSSRKRYWVVDDSPRIYVSTNPWKVTATFETISSSSVEYMKVIESLKATAPQTEKKSKIEQAHLALIEALESRIDAINSEVARVHRARRKIEQRQILLAQAEIRETRTRRQTRRPDYVYNDVESSEDDVDEYKFEDENDEDDAFDHDGFFVDAHPETRSRRRGAGVLPQRRSTRVTRGKRSSPELPMQEWRGERRSSRLGAPEDMQLDRPAKRARTEESTTSSGSVGLPSSDVGAPENEQKAGGQSAAVMKTNEIPVEQVNGKKKSKFWYYAVEPIAGPARTSMHGGKILATTTNGNGHIDTSNGWLPSSPEAPGGMDVDRCVDEPPPSFTEHTQRPLLSGD